MKFIRPMLAILLASIFACVPIQPASAQDAQYYQYNVAMCLKDISNGTGALYAQCVSQVNPDGTSVNVDTRATGTLNAATLNAAYTLNVNSKAVAGFKVSGLTGTGATLTVEGSYDNGVTWATINSVAGGTGFLFTTYTTDANFTIALGGRTNIRLRVSTVGTGTITIASNVSNIPTDFRLSSPLPPSGSTGKNYSSNLPTLPNVGANFAASGPYASYVLAYTIPANNNRYSIDCENNTGAQIAILRDDGTAANAAAPVNASIFSIAGGAGLGQQGGSWSDNFFKGRIQVYVPATLTGNAFAVCMED